MTKQNIIVCAVDGSEAAKNAVRWAANTAVKRGVPLRLVSSYAMPQFLYAEGMVPPQELYDDLEAETLEKVNEATEAAKEFAPGVDVSHQIEEGSPIDMLLDLSEQCEMVVMGSRGLGGFSGMVLGSVSGAVVSHASCPVVVVREDNHVTEANKYGPVVVGVDGSEVSQKALENAFKEASARGAKLVAVHTWMDMQVQASLAGLAAAQQQWKVVEEEQHAILGERLAGFTSNFPDVEVVKVVTRDRPARALSEASEGAQLLVVGSHGRGGFKGMLLGSTSRSLLQSTPVPLMVVRGVEPKRR